MRAALSLSAMALTAALCLSPATAQTADALREALLAAPLGWTMNWPQALPPWSGVGNVIFRARGDSLVALIENETGNVSCERDVTVTGEEVRFDLCRETGLVLRYQPGDKEIPLRGRTERRWYIFHPRGA
jgi:hypothetical protein